MTSLSNRIVRMLLILSVGIMPMATLDCDLEDGELEFDLDGWHGYGHDDYWHDDYGYEEEYYYYDDYYEPWDWWW